MLYSPQGGIIVEERTGSCTLSEEELPPDWLEEFPTGERILEWVLQNRPTSTMSPDERLLKRRACEFEVFASIEARHVLPRIKGGFQSVDDFVEYAGGVLNRRKSRSGRSLELQTHQILQEESINHSIAPHTEGKRKPDLILPGIANYRNNEWPADRLRMLALKTTCKDRWRQVLNEAARIRPKHLLTLQEGVSQDQHKEMEEEGVVLVVPERLKSHYPDEVKPKLVSLQAFIEEVRRIQ